MMQAHAYAHFITFVCKYACMQTCSHKQYPGGTEKVGEILEGGVMEG